MDGTRHLGLVVPDGIDGGVLRAWTQLPPGQNDMTVDRHPMSRSHAGLWSVGVTTTLRQTGPEYWVLGC